MTDPNEPTNTEPTLAGAELEHAIGYDDGFMAGWHAAKADGLTIEERDEQLARRITALLIQHDYNGQLIASVLATKPYNERGIPRRTPAELAAALHVAPFEDPT